MRLIAGWSRISSPSTLGSSSTHTLGRGRAVWAGQRPGGHHGVPEPRPGAAALAPLSRLGGAGAGGLHRHHSVPGADAAGAPPLGHRLALPARARAGGAGRTSRSAAGAVLLG